MVESSIFVLTPIFELSYSNVACDTATCTSHSDFRLSRYFMDQFLTSHDFTSGIQLSSNQKINDNEALIIDGNYTAPWSENNFPAVSVVPSEKKSEARHYSDTAKGVLH